jgi:hypothetical protein
MSSNHKKQDIKNPILKDEKKPGQRAIVSSWGMVCINQGSKFT